MINKTTQGTYITSSRAAQLSGYSQDYVGQLCRSGSIGCKRISGEWQVVLQSLLAYKKRFNSDDIAKNTEVLLENDNVNVDTDNGHQDVIKENGNVYISSADAAKRTGYSQDYIGQLARSGSVSARKVGRKWFVEQDALESHKRHNDGLLAAVQAGSVGTTPTTNIIKTNKIPIVTYKRDDGSTAPSIPTQENVIETKPEVKVMPNNAENIVHNVDRIDVRKNKNTADTYTRYKSINIDSSPVSENINKDKRGVSPLTQTVSRYIASLIILISFTTIVMSILAPDTLRTRTLTVLDFVGYTSNMERHMQDLKDTTLGKKTFQLLDSSMVYQRSM